MWDARKLKLPVKVFDGLPAARQAGVCFSPDESLIVTGVAMISVWCLLTVYYSLVNMCEAHYCLVGGLKA